MQHPEYLYHYTSFHHLPKILEAGFLKLTPSNLVEPKRYWRRADEGGGYSIVSDTDDVKPVVWLTKEELGADAAKDAVALGLDTGHIAAVNKMEVKFVVPWNDKYEWWLDWQKRNRMKKKQYRLFTSHGEHYGSWYVCEEPIPLSDVEKVVDNRTGEVIWERKAGGE